MRKEIVEYVVVLIAILLAFWFLGSFLKSAKELEQGEKEFNASEVLRGCVDKANLKGLDPNTGEKELYVKRCFEDYGQTKTEE